MDESKPNEPIEVQLFTRVPAFAETKTRLIPALGAGPTTELAGWLLARALGAAEGIQGPRRRLCFSGDWSPQQSRQLRRRGWQLTPQVDGDLGVRMYRCLSLAWAEGRKAVLFGSDLPLLNSAYLAAAVTALEQHDLVLGPTLDGGYGLIGLKQPAPGLFHEMQWSHSRVAAETIGRAITSGLRVYQLDALWDVDDAVDLRQLTGFLGEFSPELRARLKALGVR